MTMQEINQATILIVDDEEANLDLLEGFLEMEGYERVTTVRDSRQALERFDTLRPDLVLLDLHMPHLDGFAVMEQLSGRATEHDFLPILVLTADINAEAKRRALESGAHDFLTKPLDAIEVVLRIRNLLETRLLHLQQRSAVKRAEAGERRAEFLAEASQILAASFDYQTTIDALTRLAVPAIADYCAMDVVDGAGGFTRIGSAHADPAKEALVREISDAGGGAVPPRHPVMQALSAAHSTLLPEISPAIIAAVLATPGQRSVAEQLGPRSLISVPLTSAGQILGALTLVYSDSGRRYNRADLALAEDLAQRAALAIENTRLFSEAQEATRARDEILAVVVHDLRNPLHTIQMGTELLLENVPDGSQRKHLDIVRRSAERMNRLIQDLLEVARIEGGKLALELHTDSVSDLLDEALSMLRPLAAARGIRLEQEICDNPPQVSMDSARILQVISNLVGNAIKFTPEGGRIALRCEATDGEVQFAISDTGQGIAPEQLPHIFGRFWQARGTDRRGIGLGLSIARGIVEAHGGRIWVESTPGNGSTFHFTIPQAAVPVVSV